MTLRCDNCGRTYADDNELARVFPDIPDLLARIEPGGTVPHGECPHCGCLVYQESGPGGADEEPDEEWHLSAYRRRVCGELVAGLGFRDHLESHNPNAVGMDWDEIQAQFVSLDADEQRGRAQQLAQLLGHPRVPERVERVGEQSAPGCAAPGLSLNLARRGQPCVSPVFVR